MGIMSDGRHIFQKTAVKLAITNNAGLCYIYLVLHVYCLSNYVAVMIGKSLKYKHVTVIL